jgi:hypothetical protein
MNLHVVANKLISRIHPNETCLLRRASGMSNDKGRMVPTFEPGVEVEAQIQSESADELAHQMENVGSIEETRKAFLYASPAAGPVSRPLAKGGDMLRRPDGTWWLVTAMMEDFTNAGWVLVRITLQVEGPEGGDG